MPCFRLDRPSFYFCASREEKLARVRDWHATYRAQSFCHSETVGVAAKSVAARVEEKAYFPLNADRANVLSGRVVFQPMDPLLRRRKSGFLCRVFLLQLPRPRLGRGQLGAEARNNRRELGRRLGHHRKGKDRVGHLGPRLNVCRSRSGGRR